jgi:hypothetical protein
MMAELRERLRILDEASAPDQWSEIQVRSPGHPTPVESRPWRRVAAAAVAVVVAAAGTVFAVGALTPERGPEPGMDPTNWPVHEVHQLGLTFRYPSTWRVQPFEEMVGHAGFTGAVVSNLDHTFRHPDLGPNEATSAWDLRGLPDDAVVLSIERVDAIGMPRAHTDSPRPLDLGRAREQDRYRPDATWEHLWLPFVLDGLHDSVRVWFGPEASDHDREVARQIVASIEPVEPVEPFDGWLVDVADDYSPAGGPLVIEVGRIRDVPENDAHPWIQHTVVLRNIGDVPLHFDDTRMGKLLGRPGPELFAGDEGCGYADPGAGRPLEWGVCLGYLDAFTILPYGIERRTVTLWKDLRSLEPLHPGRYVFDKVYRFRIGDSGGQREVEVSLTYRIRRA